MSEFTTYTHLQRPELESRLSTFGQVWPEFIFHDEVARAYTHYTVSTFAHLNLYLCDEHDGLVAAGYGVPLAWDGSMERLPAGWDAALEQAVQDHEAHRSPTTFCALAAMVRQSDHGHGLSKYVLHAMKSAARQAKLERMIAPVRPTLKSQYPLTPIERYLTWKHIDGSPFDPWLRVHWKEGGKLVKSAPHSMRVRGKVEEWEKWTHMRFPESGEYVVPGTLQPVSIDCERDEGTYTEPNIWVQHSLFPNEVERA
jgi:hypothetical protein